MLANSTKTLQKLPIASRNGAWHRTIGCVASVARAFSAASAAVNENQLMEDDEMKPRARRQAIRIDYHDVRPIYGQLEDGVNLLDDSAADSSQTLCKIVDAERSESAWLHFMSTHKQNDTTYKSRDFMQLFSLIVRAGMDSNVTRDRIGYLMQYLTSAECRVKLTQTEIAKSLLLLVQYNSLDAADIWFKSACDLQSWKSNGNDETLERLKNTVECRWIEDLLANDRIKQSLQVFQNNKDRCGEIHSSVYSAFISGFSRLHTRSIRSGVDSNDQHLSSAVKFLMTKRRLKYDTDLDLAPIVNAVFDGLLHELQRMSKTQMVSRAALKLNTEKAQQMMRNQVQSRVMAAELFIRMMVIEGVDDEQQLLGTLLNTDAISAKVITKNDPLIIHHSVVEQFIRGYAQLGEFADAKRWFDVYRKVKPANMHNQTRIWNLMLKAALRTSLTAQEYDQPELKVKRQQALHEAMVRAGVARDHHTKCIMMNSIAKSAMMSRLRDVLQYYDDNDCDAERSVYLNSQVIDVCINSLRDLTSIRARNERFGAHLPNDFMPADEDRMDVLFQKQHKLVDLLTQTRNPLIVVHYLLKRMKDQEVAPNVVTYTSIIQGFFSTLAPDDAMQIYNNIKDLGMNVDLRLGYSVLHGLCRHQRYDEAVQVYEDINTLSSRERFSRIDVRELNMTTFAPDVYNGLIYAYGQSGDIIKAEQLFEQVRESKAAVGIDCYNSMLAGYVRQMRECEDIGSKNAWFTKSLDLLRQLTGHKADDQPSASLPMPTLPNLVTYSRLMQVTSLSNRYDTVLKFFNLIIKDASVGEIDDQFVANFLRCLDSRHQWYDVNFYGVSPDGIANSDAHGCDISIIRTAFSALLQHPLTVNRQQEPAQLHKKHYGHWKRSLYYYRLFNQPRKIVIGPRSYLTYLLILKRRKDGANMLLTVKRMVQDKVQLGATGARSLVDIFEQSSLSQQERDNSQLASSAAIAEIFKFEDELHEQWNKLQDTLPLDYYEVLSTTPEQLPTFDDLISDTSNR